MPSPDILLYLDSYPDPIPVEAIEQAVAFAARLSGSLTALAVHIDIRVPHNKIADYLIGLSRLEKEEEGNSLEACRRLFAHFEASAKQVGLTGHTLLDRANLYSLGQHVAQRARTRDLCMMPVVGPLDSQRWLAEAAVFESGRPVLLYWPGVANLPEVLNTVLFAWDGSRCAARAMADAMPVFTRAKSVVVFTALGEKPGALAGVGADAVRHLQAHGVTAAAEERNANGRRIGQVLDDYAREVKADVLVMGAYGRSRIKEFILGGATEHVLSKPVLPVLLSH